MASAVPAPISPAPAAASDAGLLFEEHSERLFGYCLRFLGSRADAEDAVQTTFLYAHRALERGEVPELEYAWLHSIAKNVCRWHLRTLSRRGSLTTELDLDAMPGSAGDEIETRELRGELQDALASVPESQRKALVLREWHGLESHEIATQLGMSTTATYALLTRARRSLAKALTTSGQRPLLGIDLISMVGKLKALLAGGTAKVVATTVVAGSVALGGVAVERATDGGSPSRKTPSPVADRDTGVRTAPVVSPRQRGATATLPSTVATK
ncbi:MAG: sigma-70 family RNA polymerase sigma factor, partial [Actinobacteria bacterium]|nr:sigma-70 family RNA polymerase sigma factor [Actinomycetota bacterium]